MIRRRSFARNLIQVEIPVLLVLAFALAPFIWMLLTSIKPNADLSQFPVRYLPSSTTFEHYQTLIQRTSFPVNLLNSLIIACGAVLLGLAASVPAAYAFSRFRFAGRRTLMTSFLVINMFPIVLLIIPLFVLMRMLGLIDTFIGVIIGHSTFSIPFSIWMLVSYFNAIPKDLDEAATIDGASRLQTIRLVVLPLVMPGIVTTAIYVFITSWNEYLFAMMLSGETVRPVTVALQLFIGEFTVQWGILTAGGTIIALPVTILFLFVQKRLVGGLTAGAVKS
ncbi:MULTISPECIES: carbohydrate ABC transporter permease [Bosea]|uniref:carbohydrate ABC transporter permease n=1 Tax=Bosea TaxID=85413 RepID=UPI00214F887D|nr:MULTISPECIES: carbohydrate ABC transporter permease [Bosea]MCR4520645.1 carbohydrate ABC transporter permease [Bosea sp. 47.2.35]MDR6828413.1 multiple sugar transport system permease protein [Bosea robiniae]MDR6895072.1 multiple sugar transport system permease protein [Bosea sp. BE109]MDR7138362.1 multiple sugar transport system permease protein [Bosea sp. BE168]MDR7175061.1 multiple sugar transport system permease protein [Bosea sp. BE271]